MNLLSLRKMLIMCSLLFYDKNLEGIWTPRMILIMYLIFIVLGIYVGVKSLIATDHHSLHLTKKCHLCESQESWSMVLIGVFVAGGSIATLLLDYISII